MPPRLRLFYSGLTLGLLLIPAVALYSELARRSDIWWTPPAMASTLGQSRSGGDLHGRQAARGQVNGAAIMDSRRDRLESGERRRDSRALQQLGADADGAPAALVGVCGSARCWLGHLSGDRNRALGVSR